MASTPVSGARAVAPFVRPRSIAIVGMSARPGSSGQVALSNLVVNDYGGEIHLVGRGGDEFDGRRCLESIDDLPEGVDLAIFAMPGAAVLDAVEACVRRGVHGAVIFAAGFAECGDEGRALQRRISEIADAGGLALVGPNCLGYTNFIDGLRVGFFGGVNLRRLVPEDGPGIAVLGQSGALVLHICAAFAARSLPCSHYVTTGNEAGLGLSDFIEFFVDDPATRIIAIFAEQVRRPREMLVAAARARAAGKHIVMLHPGRSERAQKAACSHTGAIPCDYTVMRMFVERAGILLVDTLEEIVDVTEMLLRFPEPPTRGVGIVTFSGAYCGMAHDFCASAGLELPELSRETVEFLRSELPEYAQARNPLDLTTRPAWHPDLLGIGIKALLDDPAIGAVVTAINVDDQPMSMNYLNGLLPHLGTNTKPFVLAVLGDGAPLFPGFVSALSRASIPLFRSPERALRGVAALTAWARRQCLLREAATPSGFESLPAFGAGTQSEWVSKRLLSAIGIKTPLGGLARNLGEALEVARRIGYPVALKAQSNQLLHKSGVGGVLPRIDDDAAMRRAWGTLECGAHTGVPEVVHDEVLVEAMGNEGFELALAARRDPQWGPVLMIGTGGRWLKVLGDFSLLPTSATEEEIERELLKLRARACLAGFRGAPPLDVAAVAHVAALVGRLMETCPLICEIDINPLIVYSEGLGALARDVVVVSAN